MNNNFAYLLVFHGSRNPSYSEKITQLGNLVSQQANTAVEVASLEFPQIPLAKVISQMYRKATARGYAGLKIIPMFLSKGVHVKEDLPQEVEHAKQSLGITSGIALTECLGCLPQLEDLVSNKFTSGDGSRILLAHGSRRSQGNEQIELLANNIGVEAAYWTVKPDLESKIELLAKQNETKITIVPYFLFLGKITEAIAEKVTQLQKLYPQIQFSLATPLGATPELATAITKLLSSKQKEQADEQVISA